MYRHLDSQKIVETVQALRSRIDERFPEAGLSKLAAELLAVSNETVGRIQWIRKPHLPLRAARVILMAAIISILLGMLANIDDFRLHEFSSFIQALEASLSAMFFIGAAVLFLATWETRIKRSRVLRALHELRSMAHIVDMHQLTKDPEQFIFPSAGTASSPARCLTPFELSRYLDYCSELLAIISKIAALYSEGLEDPVVLDAVDDVEDLAAQLSRKIWQKLTILDHLQPPAGAPR